MSSLLQEAIAHAQSLAEPIDGASGTDVSYDEDFERIKSEVDKLSSMSGEQPNWSDVVVSGEELLREKSKDMRLLVWASVGRLRTGGLKGFAQGLAAVKEVCNSHWDPMFPTVRRARARGNLAGWLSDQGVLVLGEAEVAPTEREALETVEQLCRDLDGVLSDKLGGDYPGLGGLLSLLRDKSRRLAAEAPKPPPPAPPVAAPAAAAPAPVAAAAPLAEPTPAAAVPAAVPAPPVAAAPAIAIPAAPKVGGSADVVPALRALGKSISECAAALRKEDPAQAWAYGLQRTGLWLVVKGAPPAEAGKTKIPPPQAAQVKKLEALVQGEQWMELLTTAEGLTSTYLFWFDLHRWVALAMDRLGALFVEARETVGRDVTRFTQRFPVLLDLSFADGTPFASASTKSWLEEETAKQGGGGGGGGAAAAQLDEEEREIAARFEEAKAMAAGGKVAEALALSSQLAERGADLRTRLRGRLEVAQMAMQGDKADIALAILEGLCAALEAHALDQWEPKLAARIYAALLTCRRACGEGLSGQSGSPALSDAELFARLCRIEPATALKLAR